jgi:hypothetical protein
MPLVGAIPLPSPTDLKDSFGAGAHVCLLRSIRGTSWVPVPGEVNRGQLVARWSAEPLLDVEQHENARDNDDIQEQPDNADRVVGIPLFGRRVLRQRR